MAIRVELYNGIYGNLCGGKFFLVCLTSSIVQVMMATLNKRFVVVSSRPQTWSVDKQNDDDDDKFCFLIDINF